MDDFYTARDNTLMPLLWTSIAPPFTPIIDALIFFQLRKTLADLGTIYLMVLGVVAIVIMLKAPSGIWGMIKEKYDIQIFPLNYRVVKSSNMDTQGD